MPNFEHSYALIIGINDYGNGISSLETAVSDATEIAHLLETEHHYTVNLLLNQKATLSQLRQLLEIELPKQIQAGDRFLFYFAGHGIALNCEDGPEGYLVPQNAKLGNVSTYLRMSDVNQALLQLPCRHFLGILDCCFAGAFRWSSLRKAIAVELGTLHKERYDRFIQDPAWQVLTSAASDQSAWDAFDLKDDRGQIGVHSPFACALIEALQGKADASPPAEPGKPAGDGVITATELYLYLRDRVEIATETRAIRQTPGIYPLKKHDKGEYIFFTPGQELNLPPAPPLDESKNPYRGLSPFEEQHCNLFFGRNVLTQKLYEFVTSDSLTVVLGASGSGKSSLVKAGLIPKLRQCQDDKPWFILPPFRPGEFPFKALNNALEAVNLPAIATPNQATSSGLLTPAQSLANWFKGHPEANLLLVVDQFEELITLCHNDQERQQFFEALAGAIATHPHQLHLVLTLRSDFDPQFRNTTLQKEWQTARFVVPAMTRGELREAIEKPAEARVMYFQPYDLVEQLIDEVADMPGALPLLSFGLSELYRKYLKRQWDAENEGITIDRALTQADYQDLGGVIQSLTQRADREYQALVQENPAYSHVIRDVMMRMVAIGGSELARRRVPLSELEYPPHKNSLIKEVIEHFSKARLLVEGQDVEDNPYVEPAHDALVRGWERLLTWKQQQQESLILQRRLTPSAVEWKNLKSKEQPSGFQAKAKPVIDWLDRKLYIVENLFNKTSTQLVRLLLRTQNQQERSGENNAQFLWNANPYLDVLDKELNSNDNWFNQVEAEFVQQSVLQKRRNKSWRWRIAIAVMLGLSSLTIAALIGQRNAQISQIQASRQAAKASLFPGNQQLEALVAALRAEKTLKYDPLLQLWKPDRQSSKQEVGTLSNIVYQTQERNRLQHQNPVTDIFSAQFSPDGKYIITASGDGTARVWNLQGELLTELKGHRDTLWNAKFSPDNKYIITASADKTARVCNLQGQLLAELKGSQHGIKSVEFSPDSKYIVTASGYELANSNNTTTITGDRTARVWNLQGQLLAELKGHKEVVQTAQFSPDSKYIVTASADKTARVWNLNGQLLAELKGHQQKLWSAQFSPDNKYIVTASQDGTARVWNLQGRLLAELKGHKQFVQTAQFSPNSKYIVTGSGDRTARVWNLNGQLLTELKEHQAEVRSAQFSSNGKYIVTASDDSTAKVWNLQGQLLVELKGHQSLVYSAQFSRDGKHIVTASRDGTARVWDLQYQLLAALKGHQGEVSSAQFSPDGKYIVTASDDRTARLWNLNGQLLTELKGHLGWLNSAQFSPDGKYIVTASDDGTARVWNLNGQLLAKLKGHRNIVNNAQFSPNSKYIVTASQDGTAKVWNLNGQLIAQLKHQSSVLSAQFSPNGKYIVTASTDETAKVWNLNGQLIAQLKGHQKWVRNAQFSPDSQTIITASSDGTARLWSIQGQLLTEFKGHQKGVSNAQFSPDGRYILTASLDGTARLWRVQGQLLTELKGHQKGVPSAQFSPDGKSIVTASNDGTARVWNLQGELLAELKGHQRWLHNVQFSPDGKYIVTASGDRTARIWPIPTSSVDNHLSEVCHQIRSYLKHGSDVQTGDRKLCDGIRNSHP